MPSWQITSGGLKSVTSLLYCFFSILTPLPFLSSESFKDLLLFKNHEETEKQFFSHHTTSGHETNLTNPTESLHKPSAWNFAVWCWSLRWQVSHIAQYTRTLMLQWQRNKYLGKVNLQGSRGICRHLQIIWSNSSIVVIFMFIQSDPAKPNKHITFNKLQHAIMPGHNTQMWVTAILPPKVKGDFWHFQSSELCINGCIWLSRYDFLLVFYCNLSFR